MWWLVTLLGMSLLAGGGWLAVYSDDDESQSNRPLMINALFGAGAFVVVASLLASLFIG